MLFCAETGAKLETQSPGKHGKVLTSIGNVVSANHPGAVYEGIKAPPFFEGRTEKRSKSAKAPKEKPTAHATHSVAA